MADANDNEEQQRRLQALIKECQYYKKLAISSGEKRLAETEELRHLVARLKQTEIDLSLARAELERRVEERTKELVVANTLLQNEIRIRKEYEDTIRRTNEDLELKVAQRTAELQEAYKKVRELSLSDQLSGLRNRRFMSEIVIPEANMIMESFLKERQGEHIKRRQPVQSLGIVMIDIDHFKEVNDVHGHRAGDMLLKQFSQILRENTRKDDHLLRWGGEEFLIILRSFNPRFLHVKAEKIRRHVREYSFSIDDNATINKTCSIGCINYPFSESIAEFIKLEQAISLADQALYYAKKNGRNRTVIVALENRSVVHAKTINEIVQSFYESVEKGIVSLQIFNDSSGLPLDSQSAIPIATGD